MGRVKESYVSSYALVAQLAERVAVNHCVLGSSPSGSASYKVTDSNNNHTQKLKTSRSR